MISIRVVLRTGATPSPLTVRTMQCHLVAGQEAQVDVAIACGAAPDHCAVGIRAAAQHCCITHSAWYLHGSKPRSVITKCG
jgi:hypothetical protein